MRKWYIITTIVVVGLAVAIFAFFLVEKAPAPDTTSEIPRSGFVSFFGRQFGFDEPDTGAPTPVGSSTPEMRPTFRQRLALEKMIPVSRDMVSGITFTASTTISTTTPPRTIVIESVRYALRETGRIEDLSLDTGNVKRVTNTTVPRIQEAFFGVNGSAVALRYLADDNETVETYVAPLPTDPYASSTELLGTFFKQNIRSLAFSPIAPELFYLTAGDAGATGRIANLSGTNSRVVFSLPLKDWLAHWKVPGFIDVATTPSYLAAGAGERVSVDGAVTRTFSGTRGLSILPSPGGTRILYSQSDGNATRLFMQDRTTRESVEFFIPTLPEKCVWMDDVRVICAVPNRAPGTLPDAWYQGTVSFADSFWLLDGATGNIDFLFDPLETPVREEIDAVALSLSYNNTVLSFINKKDLRGWVADLSEWFSF